MLIFVIIREQWTDELFFFYCTENFEGWPSWSAIICRLLPRLDFLNLLFHLRNQNIKFFLTFFPCSSVNVFGNSLAVHARRESALVEMVIYDGDASRSRLAVLAPVRLKFIIAHRLFYHPGRRPDSRDEPWRHH